MTGVPVGRGMLDTETQGNGEGTDRTAGSTRQGMPEVASNRQKVGEAWNRFSLRILRRNQPSDTLISDFWPP